MRKIAILIPTADTIPGVFLPKFARIYGGLTKRGWEIALLTSDEPPLDHAREWLLRSALALSPAPDYLLWLDADMLATEEHALGLLDFLESRPEADAASCLYFKKISFEPTCAVRGQDGNMKTYRPQGEAPQEIDSAGLGMLAIRAESLREKLASKNPEKYFWFDYGGKSEDVNFCLLMRDSGMRIFLLPNLVVPHAGGQVGAWHYEKKKG